MSYFYTVDELVAGDPLARRAEDFKRYVGPRLTDEMVSAAEANLGVKLPAALVELFRESNGGFMKKPCFDVTGQEGDDCMRHVGGIGWDGGLDGELGSLYMAEEWSYPAGLLWIAGDGHTGVFLDYRSCGPQGEPAVAWYDAEFEIPPIHLADTFAEFLGQLKECDW